MSEFNGNPNSFKEAVCIEAQRIFDSCTDKDCLEDLEVIFECGSQIIIDNAAFIKVKCVEVSNVYFAIEPVPFNKGFYSIDITYLFRMVVEAFENRKSCPETVTGTARFCKKVILYGSDGSVKKFSSEDKCHKPTPCTTLCENQNLPTATVSVAEPIVLDCKLVSKYPCGCEVCCCVCKDGEDDSNGHKSHKKVFVTLGLFSIVQLQRAVPLLIPAYDYCIPERECSTSNDSPCELFEKIKFPADEFFPPSLDDIDNNNNGCGC